MRIALVTDWFHPRIGGIEVHVEALARRLAARGCTPTVLTPWPGPEEVDGIPVHRLDLPLVPGLGVCLRPLRLARAVRAALEAGAYEVAHTHVSFGSTAAIAAGWAGPRAGVPVLATFHSTLQGLGWIWVAARPLLRWPRWPFRATAVSEAVARDLEWIMPDRPVELLPNAIDPSQWRPRAGEPARPDGSGLRLVTTARLHRRKRIGQLLDLLPDVQARTEAPVTLEIMGGGPRREALERQVRRAGLDGAVRFLGPGSPGDVRAMLGRADLFVSPSDRESFGIAALEALAAGVPVVARREGGVGSFVEDGVNGLLVESDRELAEALVRVAGESGRLARLQEGAARGIPPRYTWEHQVDRHLELYRQVAAGGAE